jgi:ABC-type spermidine/putrescine transport system permease subunit II
MKKFLLLSVAGIIAPLTSLAQSLDVPLSNNDDYAYASIFAGNFSLLLSIVIGIIATFLVFRAAKRLGGGLFGLVLNYIGVGMVFIVLGTLFSVAITWYGGFWLNVMSTSFFALGYIFMVIGANKLLKGIINT